MKGRRRELREVRAKDIMQTKLVTIADQASLADLEQLLSDYKIGGVPVTDEAGHIVGVVSLRDLVDRYAEDPDARPQGAPHFYLGLGENDWVPPEGTSGGEGIVADVMTAQLHTVAHDATLPVLARKMVELGLHRVLVEEGRKVVGMVTTMDVMGAVAEDG